MGTDTAACVPCWSGAPLHRHRTSPFPTPDTPDTPPRRRKFLIRLFYFSKLWCAFKRMDTHRDMEVEENEFAAGFTRFKSDLGIDVSFEAGTGLGCEAPL